MAFSMAFSVLTISVKNKNCCTFICVCCRERLFLLWLQNSETLSVLGPEPVTRPPTEPFCSARGSDKFRLRPQHQLKSVTVKESRLPLNEWQNKVFNQSEARMAPIYPGVIQNCTLHDWTPCFFMLKVCDWLWFYGSDILIGFLKTLLTWLAHSFGL